MRDVHVHTNDRWIYNSYSRKITPLKICIGYPSLEDPRGFPQVSQNRQFQFFTTPAAIYPYIPAMAATLLKQAGHEVMWSDGPAEGLTWEQQLKQIKQFNPDLLAWEVKTPSVIGTWRRVDELKKVLPETTVVLMGDHVTALPQETIQNSKTDVVLTGGDYDFGLMEIVDWHNRMFHEPFTPMVMEGQTEELVVPMPRPMTLYKETNQLIWNTPTTSDLKTLPVVDRKLTKWWLYGGIKGSGNYKFLPGSHNSIGRDCWWRHQGGCTFCSWTNTFKNWRVGTVDQFMAEIENCASLGIREVFDDTGTFPIGEWLSGVCNKLVNFNGGRKHGNSPRVVVGANMRPGALRLDQYRDMGRAGFRFILFGLESANHETLQRINKGQEQNDMLNSARMAKEAGLEPHVTCMVGYPWESREDALKTIQFTQDLFARGYIDTLQATICIPYPGTELYRQCLENGWLKYKPGEWDAWDMSKPVMKCPMTDEEVLGITRGIYKSFLTPRYIARKVLTIRSKDDFKFLWRGLKLLYGHLTDFSGRRKPVAVH